VHSAQIPLTYLREGDRFLLGSTLSDSPHPMVVEPAGRPERVVTMVVMRYLWVSTQLTGAEHDLCHLQKVPPTSAVNCYAYRAERLGLYDCSRLPDDSAR